MVTLREGEVSGKKHKQSFQRLVMFYFLMWRLDTIVMIVTICKLYTFRKCALLSVDYNKESSKTKQYITKLTWILWRIPNWLCRHNLITQRIDSQPNHSTGKKKKLIRNNFFQRQYQVFIYQSQPFFQATMSCLALSSSLLDKVRNYLTILPFPKMGSCAGDSCYLGRRSFKTLQILKQIPAHGQICWKMSRRQMATQRWSFSPKHCNLVIFCLAL